MISAESRALDELIFERQQNGESLRAIAMDLDCNINYVRIRVRRELRRRAEIKAAESKPDWRAIEVKHAPSLNNRLRQCLYHAGFREMGEVHAAIINGSLRPNSILHLGPKSFTALLFWFQNLCIALPVKSKQET